MEQIGKDLLPCMVHYFDMNALEADMDDGRAFVRNGISQGIPVRRQAVGNIQTDDLLLFPPRAGMCFFRDWISHALEPPCMVIKGLGSYAVLSAPVADRSFAGPALFDQIEPLLIGMFDTFVSHQEITPSSV